MASHEKFKDAQTLRDSILAIKPGAPVHVDAFIEGGVYVKEFDAYQRSLWEDFIGKKDDASLGITKAIIAAISMCDESGELLFSPKDAAELSKTKGVELQKVFEASATLNALFEKDVEELAKNSDAAPSGDSA